MSQVGDARRTAVSLAMLLGFDEGRRNDVGIVVTELGTNLVRHARSGQFVFRTVTSGDSTAIEVLALDKGPGIASISEAMRDGYSTGGTPGNGLGAVRRLSESFEVYSQPQGGTALLSRIFNKVLPKRALDIGVVCLPKHGEQACGDAWHVNDNGNGRIVILVADGLGHGLQAAEASHHAVKLFQENAHLGGVNIVELLHAGLRSTRGAAVAVADIRPEKGQLLFTGVGNISATIVAGGNSRSTVSHNGTAGAEARRIQEFAYPWSNDALLVMHSDGLSTQWHIGKYNGLHLKDPSLVAGVLYRDHRRERDDVTVLVASHHRKA
jgi:anti-sigma regulatory factor (Ser/Thr protein kinase)